MGTVSDTCMLVSDRYILCWECLPGPGYPAPHTLLRLQSKPRLLSCPSD